jgi:hypothetical protein
MDHSLLILYTQSIYTTLIIGHKKDRASDFIAHRRLGTRTVHRTIACSHASLTAIHQCRRNGTRRLTHTLLGGGEPRLQMHRRFAAPAQAVESRVLGARRILGSAQHGQALGLLVRIPWQSRRRRRRRQRRQRRRRRRSRLRRQWRLRRWWRRWRERRAARRRRRRRRKRLLLPIGVASLLLWRNEPFEHRCDAASPFPPKNLRIRRREHAHGCRQHRDRAAPPRKVFRAQRSSRRKARARPNIPATSAERARRGPGGARRRARRSRAAQRDGAYAIVR